MTGLAVKKQPVKLLSSFRHAFDGVVHVITQERNARIHLLIALLVVGMGFVLRLGLLEWSLLLVAVGLVFTAEMLNTVVEILVDLTVQQVHPMAKVVKDVAAGAVLLMALVAVIIGFIVLGPPIWRLLRALAG